MLDGLPFQHFACVHADVPWEFEDWAEGGTDRNPNRHYECMSDSAIARMPVEAYAAPDAHLFFWVTGPMIVSGRHIRIMRSWGFEPTALAFVWIKLNPSWHPQWLGYIDDAMTWMGLGHTTRQNAELCLLGRRGSPVRLSKSVRQVLHSPIRQHSRKPDEIYRRIEQYCPGPRLDLFGRRSRLGWCVRGDEATKFDGEHHGNDDRGRLPAKLRKGRCLATEDA